MKKNILITVLLLLCACAPAAGRPTILYQASKPQIIDVIVDVSTSIQPGNGHNFFKVTGITESSITLVATQTGGAVAANFFFGVRQTDITMIWTVVERANGATAVAVSTQGLASSDKLENQFFARLDGKFSRLPAP
jgi:hypothetical protein